MKDYVDWSKIPDGYDWVAVDSGNGAGARIFSAGPLVGMYTIKPVCEESCWNSPGDNMDDRWVDSGAVTGPLPPWRDSLIKRP